MLYLFRTQACAWLPSISSLVTRHTYSGLVSVLPVPASHELYRKPSHGGGRCFCPDPLALECVAFWSLQPLDALHPGPGILQQSKTVFWCKKTAGVVAEDYINYGRILLHSVLVCRNRAAARYAGLPRARTVNRYACSHLPDRVLSLGV